MTLVVDADSELCNGPFKMAYRKVVAKAHALWNLQSRSTVAAGTIVDELTRGLVVPTAQGGTQRTIQLLS